MADRPQPAADDRMVTVLVSTELLAELGDWSKPVQAKVIETPGRGNGYEMVFRTVGVTPHAEFAGDDDALRGARG